MFKMKNKQIKNDKDLQEALVESQKIVVANNRYKRPYNNEYEKLKRWERGLQLDNSIDLYCKPKNSFQEELLIWK